MTPKFDPGTRCLIAKRTPSKRCMLSLNTEQRVCMHNIIVHYANGMRDTPLEAILITCNLTVTDRHPTRNRNEKMGDVSGLVP